MKFGIVNKDGEVKRSWNSFDSAAKYFAKVTDESLTLKRLRYNKPVGKAMTVEADDKEVAVKKYHPSTLEKIAAILNRGKEHPRYALYARDESGVLLLVCTTKTLEGAKFIRRKARRFARDILQRKLSFKLRSVDKASLKVA